MKNILIIAIIGVAALVIYNKFFKNSTSVKPDVNKPPVTPIVPAGHETLVQDVVDSIASGVDAFTMASGRKKTS